MKNKQKALKTAVITPRNTIITTDMHIGNPYRNLDLNPPAVPLTWALPYALLVLQVMQQTNHHGYWRLLCWGLFYCLKLEIGIWVMVVH